MRKTGGMSMCSPASLHSYTLIGCSDRPPNHPQPATRWHHLSQIRNKPTLPLFGSKQLHGHCLERLDINLTECIAAAHQLQRGRLMSEHSWRRSTPPAHEAQHGPGQYPKHCQPEQNGQEREAARITASVAQRRSRDQSVRVAWASLLSRAIVPSAMQYSGLWRHRRAAT